MRSRCFVAAVVLATAFSACSHASKDFKVVTGKVIDARSGKPIAGVSVRADSIQTTTNASGSYSLASVPKIATLAFTQANYEDANAPVAERVATKHLKPIPVTGRVVSALTKQGLTAHITAPDVEGDADDAGEFTLYGTGPGDRLQVAAKGYTSQTTLVSSARTLNLTLKPTTATVRARDLPFIAALWRRASDAWGTGGPAGAASSATFTATYNYPGLGGDCIAYVGRYAWPANYEEEYVLDGASVQRNDGWIIPFGALNGHKAEGRLYVMKLTTSYTDGTPQRLDEVHVAFLDDKPHMFVDCN